MGSSMVTHQTCSCYCLSTSWEKGWLNGTIAIVECPARDWHETHVMILSPQKNHLASLVANDYNCTPSILGRQAIHEHTQESGYRPPFQPAAKADIPIEGYAGYRSHQCESPYTIASAPLHSKGGRLRSELTTVGPTSCSTSCILQRLPSRGIRPGFLRALKLSV